MAFGLYTTFNERLRDLKHNEKELNDAETYLRLENRYYGLKSVINEAETLKRTTLGNIISDYTKLKAFNGYTLEEQRKEYEKILSNNENYVKDYVNDNGLFEGYEFERNEKPYKLILSDSKIYLYDIEKDNYDMKYEFATPYDAMQEFFKAIKDLDTTKTMFLDTYKPAEFSSAALTEFFNNKGWNVNFKTPYEFEITSKTLHSSSPISHSISFDGTRDGLKDKLFEIHGNYNVNEFAEQVIANTSPDNRNILDIIKDAELMREVYLDLTRSYSQEYIWNNYNKDEKLFDSFTYEVRYSVEELEKQAMELYKAKDRDFSQFTNGELYELYKVCLLTPENPHGRSFDDEVFDEMGYRTKNGKDLSEEFLNKYEKEIALGKALVLTDEIKSRYANGDISGAYEKWVELHDSLITENFEIYAECIEKFSNDEVYRITDYGKQKALYQMENEEISEEPEL